MKEIITPIEVSACSTKAGAPFWRIKDINGKVVTCWDEKISQNLYDNANNACEVELKTGEGFTNVRAFYGLEHVSLGTETEIPTADAIKNIKDFVKKRDDALLGGDE